MIRAHRDELVITSDAFGLVPAGMQVDAAEFARLRRELTPGPVSIAHWRPAVVEPVDLRVRPVAADPAAAAILATAVNGPPSGGILDPSRQRAAAVALAATVLAGAPPQAALLRLIGAGPGSTPAGDDVVAGVLAGLHAAGHAGAAAGLGRAVLPLLARTTAASAHYLAAAADGRFAERVHELLGGLASPAAAEVAVRAARRMGATSGVDVLAGIVAATRMTDATRKSA